MSREIFRQGALVVVDNAVDGSGPGFSVCCGDVRVDVCGGVVDVVSAGDAVVKASVVDVVVSALVERVAGWFHVHAGFVGDGTLIVGQGGAGKTTTTLALSTSSAPLLTDDVVFVQRRGDAVVARPLRRPLHVGDVTLRMFPQLRPRVVPGRSLAGKAIVDVDLDIDVDATADGGSDGAVVVRRVVFPAIADVATTSSTPLTPAQALPLLLVGSAMVTWPGLPRAQEHLDALTGLAGLSSTRLTLGRDAIDDPEVVRRVVDG